MVSPARLIAVTWAETALKYPPWGSVSWVSVSPMGKFGKLSQTRDVPIGADILTDHFPRPQLR